MRAYELIQKKRDGGELTAGEISAILAGYVAGEIPDYQMSAFLMAVYFRGMSPRETADFTLAMVRSGETLDLGAIRGTKVDKHSTGGVGDKTSLVLIPLVAAAGAPVAKMSGRGLGHTGGTIDKLESIPGFRTQLDTRAFIDQVNRVGCAIVAATNELVPADRKLYSLRDVTATVDSLPLIASSVMSKKIAGGSDAIVLDVKTGSGAFMKTLDGARELAQAMVGIGAQVGRRTIALITDMDQPLGRAVGNALEVAEAIETLRGDGPMDLRELCLELGAQMVTLAGVARSAGEGKDLLMKILDDGSALAKFAQLVDAQGGDRRVVDDSRRLPAAPVRIAVEAPSSGVVAAVDAQALGLAAMGLGAGRATKDDRVDPAVGVVLVRKVGDPVRDGEPLADVHAPDRARAAEAGRRIQAAYRIAARAPASRPLIHGVIT
ncbi:MAG: pyrimidine-nucleoside phosphorylase [Bacillati bacterium ANGP1]|uniref:Pyrimidine-nucleoside phosphorylase n=1 Tax=Candidatus Segetimicrobium genomatis TaxID=2569760 RepID=A0A537IV72_9BACT|nr:MAG: pyrimidine-nucleoside phosphorylase [Terrabacteria group bacterium ANGP1]